MPTYTIKVETQHLAIVRNARNPQTAIAAWKRHSKTNDRFVAVRFDTFSSLPKNSHQLPTSDRRQCKTTYRISTR